MRSRIATELEFLGEPRKVDPEPLASRIEVMRQELADAERSTQALLAISRLALA